VDEHGEPTRRQDAAIEVEQVDGIETQQISLYRVAMLIEQVTEAS
jgi:hypothetical protein